MLVRRLLIQNAAWLAAMAVVLFVAAGTLNWPAAWIFLAETGIGGVAVSLWLARHDPGLLKERLAPPVQPRQKGWDKVFLAAILVFWMAWLALMALDAARFRASHVPVWAQAVGAALVAVCLFVTWLTFRENSFAAPVVKIQKERGHAVVSTGPYAMVRHPMYAGALLFFVGVPLLLGSWLGLAAAPILVVVLAVRAVMEERMLMAELEGYGKYAERVRYRLVPGVW